MSLSPLRSSWLVPRYIAHRCRQGVLSGQFSGAALFLDISRFTSITEELVRRDREGVEVLSSLLDGVFIPVIEHIYQHRGFVAQFAGDALLALFPDHHPVLACDVTIHQYLRALPPQHTRFGTFSLSAKLGLARGSIYWDILGQERLLPLFYGPAIMRAVQAEQCCRPNELVWHSTIQPPRTVAAIRPGTRFNRYARGQVKARLVRAAQDMPDHGTIAPFVHPAVQRLDVRGEFRDLVVLFIGLGQTLAVKKRHKEVCILIQQAQAREAYVHQLAYNDKGYTMVLFFGAPQAMEKPAQHALAFARSAIQIFPDVSMGIAQGTAYTGMVGSTMRATYTALGMPVNMAARLMQQAVPGTALCSKSFARLLPPGSSRASGHVPLKGMQGRVAVYTVQTLTSVTNRRYTTPMVGRETELQRVLDHLRPLHQGRSAGICYIYGPAGAGKSRLVHQVRQRIAWCQTLVLQAENQCNPQHLCQPLQAFLGLAADTSNIRDFTRAWQLFCQRVTTLADIRAPSLAETLQTHQALFAYLLGYSTPEAWFARLSAPQQAESSNRAIKDCYKAMTLLAPLILTVEDLHALEAGTKDALAFLTRNIADYPMALLVTSRLRDDGGKPVIDQDSDVLSLEIVLQGLAEADIRTLMQEYFSQPISQRFISDLMARTRGNPMFVEQFCRYLRAVPQLLNIQAGELTLDCDRLQIPNTINAVITTRLDRLPHPLHRLLRLAVVLGMTFNRYVLTDMNRRARWLPGNRAVLRALAQGTEQGIWYIERAHWYRFHHQLMQQAGYDMLLRDDIRKLHGFAARAMAAHYCKTPGYAGDIAQHFHKAGCRKDALPYLWQAAKRAEQSYAFLRAEFYYRTLSGYSLGDREKALARTHQAEMLVHLGRWRVARQRVEENIAFAEDRALPDLEAKNRYILGKLLFQQGQREPALAHIHQARDIYHRIQDSREEMKTMRILADDLIRRGAHVKAMEILNTLQHNAETRNENVAVTQILTLKGKIHTEQGDMAQAEACFTKALDIAQRHNLLLRIASAMHNLAGVLYTRGESSKGMHMYKQALQTYERLGLLSFIADTLANIGAICASHSRYKEALTHLNKQMAIGRELGKPATVASALEFLGLIHFNLGDRKKAWHSLDQARELYMRIQDPNGLAYVYGSIGRMCQENGELDRAETYFKKQLALFRQTGSKAGMATAYGYLGNICLRRGQLEEAMALYKKRLSLAPGPRIEGYAYGNMAQVAQAQGRYNQAIALLHKKLACCWRIDDSYGLAFCYKDIGDNYLRKGAGSLALRCMEHAVHTATKHGLDKNVATILYTKAEMLYKLQRYADSLACLDDAEGLCERFKLARYLTYCRELREKLRANSASDKGT